MALTLLLKPQMKQQVHPHIPNAPDIKQRNPIILSKQKNINMNHIKKSADLFQIAKLRVIHNGHYKDGDEIRVYQFDHDWIKHVVKEDIQKGNYRIGRIENGSFHVCYIGRATEQLLQERLL